MPKGSKRHVREAEEKAFEANKRLTKARLEAVEAGINLAVEKLRLLRDKLPESNEIEFDEIICGLRDLKDSIQNPLVKREPEDGAAGN